MMGATVPDLPASGWILADFDDTLAPDDSHAGLLRFILRRRIWPLLLWPVMALGGLVYLLPSQRRRGISLIWWAITLGLSPLGWRRLVRAYCRTRPGLFQEARALLLAEGQRCWVLSASPRALVRGQLHQQLPGQLPHRILGSRMHYRLGGLMPRFYCHGRHKILPGIQALGATLALSDSLHDLPLLAEGQAAWLINPTPARLQRARQSLPRIEPRYWSL
ncbi:HAD family hydrolase [Aeromonas dhakensis]|uniref:HAD family hydrolase n=1 Tax=Aeromonas dhakensis TaxID=196024 RepID=UPI001A8F84C1|nr:HAD family hydrolase [Aeromonas dhakensis]QSR42982.1 haloacid dehalogenase-like hydrolase [Aeromonas dhakensis]UCM51766.1 haloacid dehalogenase-like hydrolase [Aeromonas dhakensis]